MRIIALTLLLFTFSCTSNQDSSKSVDTNLDSIEVSTSEIEEVRNTEEESQYLLPHLREMDLSKIAVGQDAFDKVDDLIRFTIKIEKSDIALEDLNNYKEEFFKKIESTMSLVENMDGEAGSILIEYMQPLHEITDITFDSDKKESFNDHLQSLKVYLGNFYKTFPKPETQDN